MLRLLRGKASDNTGPRRRYFQSPTAVPLKIAPPLALLGGGLRPSQHGCRLPLTIGPLGSPGTPRRRAATFEHGRRLPPLPIGTKKEEQFAPLNFYNDQTPGTPLRRAASPAAAEIFRVGNCCRYVLAGMCWPSGKIVI